MTATFSSHLPVTLRRELLRCKVCEVEFEQPVDQVSDWDDRQRTVQGLSGSKEESVKNQVHMFTGMLKTELPVHSYS